MFWFQIRVQINVELVNPRNLHHFSIDLDTESLPQLNIRSQTF